MTAPVKGELLPGPLRRGETQSAPRCEPYPTRIGRDGIVGVVAVPGHFFMELAERLALVGLATETEFACPLSQFVLADALGLTSIHEAAR